MPMLITQVSDIRHNNNLTHPEVWNFVAYTENLKDWCFKCCTHYKYSRTGEIAVKNAPYYLDDWR